MGSVRTERSQSTGQAREAIVVHAEFGGLLGSDAGGAAQDRADTGVGVLNVIDRVVVLSWRFTASMSKSIIWLELLETSVKRVASAPTSSSSSRSGTIVPLRLLILTG